MKKERNLKRITLGEEMLEYVLGNPKNYIVKNEFPDGAVIKDMYRKPASQTFEVVFQHDSWEEVEEGEMVPELDIEVHEKFCTRCDNKMMWDQKMEEQYCPNCNRKFITGRRMNRSYNED